MDKITIAIVLCMTTGSLKAWWDPGHLVTAMIAYMHLSDHAREQVDELTAVMARDYPHMNHFITTGPWPDDLKVEGVRTYDTWHYTNLPHNRDGISIQEPPEIDVIWAISQMTRVLRSPLSRKIEKARHLSFLVHFVGDIHQPLHSTTVYSNRLPGGNVGGNLFSLDGEWSNLHMLWDDGCGFLSSYNDINPYGEPKDPLSEDEIERVRSLAEDLIREYPRDSIAGIEWDDPDFWALESHKLALDYGYYGINSVDESGRDVRIFPGATPTELYLKEGQKVVKQRLATAGYRLADLLNKVFSDE
jgi:hypothetical protein